MTNYAIAATGTGGHVFPALAIANALGDDVIWFGTESGLERKYCNRHIALDAAPVVGKSNKIARIINLLCVIPKVCRVLKEAKVEHVIVFGGYISVPVGIASYLMGIKLTIQEQNAIPGRANRLLFPLADLVFTSFPGVFSGKKVHMFGNPLRFTRAWKEPKNVLVIGGSLGANSIYETVIVAAANLNYNFRIVSGLMNKVNVEVPANVELVGFSDDMSSMYNWADVLVARSGALTISEALEYGLPMLLVPLPNSADNHQEFNARAVIMASVILESEFSVASLSHWLKFGSDSALSRILAKL